MGQCVNSITDIERFNGAITKNIVLSISSIIITVKSVKVKHFERFTIFKSIIVYVSYSGWYCYFSY